MNDHPLINHIREKGFRVTPQRLLILQILQDADRHLTPVEIFHMAQEQMPGITEATVYRTLSFLDKERLILCAHVGGGQLVYEHAKHVHHHLVCDSCGGEIEISDELVQGFFDRLKRETGFVVRSSHVTLFGLCPECNHHLVNQ